MELLVDIRNLSKSFPGVKALDNVRFDLRPGEVHALMGENGAGKSTLMKILSGVYRKDTGEIRIDGKEVEMDGPKAAQALGISIIHQELNLMNHLSAAKNIFIGREPRVGRGWFINERQMNRDAEALFRRMNLSIDPAVDVGTLTVASQQLVEIAKALSFNARVLIMDEPTAALNDREIEDLFRIIRDLRAQGVGIVYISHKMDEIRRISDRITVMRDGQYVATVPASETPIETIIQMMVGRDLGVEEITRPDTSAAPVALEVKGLCRGRAIRDVSFKARKGEIVGFAGLMGAGRTEVARAIFGADPLDSGEIHVNGSKVEIRTPADGVRHRIGYLSEDRKRFGLVTGMDVQTNVVMATVRKFLTGRIFLSPGRITETARTYVRRLAIKTPNVRQQVRLLSGGNQQKIVIAKWLERDCDILFFDEPTRGIDIGAKREIYQLLDELAAQGRTIIMISSELPEVLRLSHRILVMCEGRITGELSAEEATQENIMALATRRDTPHLHASAEPEPLKKAA